MKMLRWKKKTWITYEKEILDLTYRWRLFEKKNTLDESVKPYKDEV